MSIFGVTYSERVVDLLPPDKRFSRMVQFMRAIVAPLQLINADIFTQYRTGSTASNWSNLTTYAVKDRVKYNGKVYESIVAGNIGNVPTDATKWRTFLDSFVGVEERLLYNHQKIVLEYALNRRFQTTFRQPPSVSDIYIDTNTPTIPVFVVGATESESSVSYSEGSSEFVIDGYNFTAFNNFTVWVPVAVFNAVSADATAREKIFRNFIDRYNTAGIIYNVSTY